MILILGGTSDSLTLAKALIPNHDVILSVATELGSASAAELKKNCRIEVGRKDCRELTLFIRENGIRLLIDGTHPYALLASENGKRAAEQAKIPYFRYSRPGAKENDGETVSASESVLWMTDYEEAADYLEHREGNIFSTLGSKNIRAFLDPISKKSRITARVLPEEGSIRSLREAGLEYHQIIAMKGPFSMEMNLLMMKEKNTAFLVTKDSGAAGGFSEKLDAAKALGVTVLIIRRSEKDEATVFSEMEALLEAVRILWQKEKPMSESQDEMKNIDGWKVKA